MPLGPGGSLRVLRVHVDPGVKLSSSSSSTQPMVPVKNQSPRASVACAIVGFRDDEAAIAMRVLTWGAKARRFIGMRNNIVIRAASP